MRNKKDTWFICLSCMERFFNGAEKHHKVSTPDGQRCMSAKQLALTFRRDEERKGWVVK